MNYEFKLNTLKKSRFILFQVCDTCIAFSQAYRNCRAILYLYMKENAINRVFFSYLWSHLPSLNQIWYWSFIWFDKYVMFRQVSIKNDWLGRLYVLYPMTIQSNRYPNEIHLKLTSREISFVQNILLSCQIALKICTQSTAMISPCSAQNLKMIWQLSNKLRTNEISRDVSSRCLSNGYPIV